jgi:hypothetical protein
MGKRSAHKTAPVRRENSVQAAITTLNNAGWDVTMQDGTAGEGDDAVDVVRVLLVSPWQPKELLPNEDLGLLAGREL